MSSTLQPWAITGAITATADFRDGFWLYCDNLNLDAPLCLPSGSTVAVTYLNERNAVGGVVLRNGAYQ